MYSAKQEKYGHLPAHLSTEAQQGLERAKRLTSMFDYAQAIRVLEQIPDHQNIPDCVEAIASIRATADNCVPVDLKTVPHIFYHSLICDPERCFDASGHDADVINGFNAWMITCDEYRKCLQMLYDEGYVVINISDCYVQNDEGQLYANPNLRLPKGKKALIVSYDDLSYYAQYEGMGVADRLVLNEEMRLKNEYTDLNGKTTVGDYDWLPIMDAFVDEHPDFSWHGHKGTIAMTGYDGVFGYRTDVGFFTNPTQAEKSWLEHHPDISLDHLDMYVSQAKRIADAIKADGYEFACHTWGHLDVRESTYERIVSDHRRFQGRVSPIIGKTEILIFAHGTDIALRYEGNEKYQYYRGEGFRVFCNVCAANLFHNEYTPDYIRQERIDMDGYQLYMALSDPNRVIAQLGIDAEKVFDPIRPTPITCD